MCKLRGNFKDKLHRFCLRSDLASLFLSNQIIRVNNFQLLTHVKVKETDKTGGNPQVHDDKQADGHILMEKEIELARKGVKASKFNFICLLHILTWA